MIKIEYNHDMHNNLNYNSVLVIPMAEAND
jgi:hypothetical protein